MMLAECITGWWNNDEVYAFWPCCCVSACVCVREGLTRTIRVAIYVVFPKSCCVWDVVFEISKIKSVSFRFLIVNNLLLNLNLRGDRTIDVDIYPLFAFLVRDVCPLPWLDLLRLISPGIFLQEICNETEKCQEMLIQIVFIIWWVIPKIRIHRIK